MKKLLVVIGLFACILTLSAQENSGLTLRVVLENVPNNEGSILSALHTEETFLKVAGIKKKKDKAEKGELVLIFNDVEPGTYAVSVLHDANDNQRMDYEVNGMPKENYAMSQNPMLMGPPTFKDVKFIVAEDDLELHIRF